MIKRIRLKNWKSHLETELTFSRGVNVLTGIMGSGKTSVVEAISFALFGTFPGLQTKKVSIDELIMNMPIKKDRSEIELEFFLNNKNYTIKRIIERGKGTTYAEIRENGKLIDINAKNVTNIVKELLQMDYELFSKAVYSEQNAMDYFLNIPRGKRMQYIDRMLKLEIYEKVRERVVAIRNRIKERYTEILKMLSNLKDERIEEKMKFVKMELKKLKKEMDNIKVKLDYTKEKRGLLEKKLDNVERAQQELTEIMKELESTSAVIKEVELNITEKMKRLGDRNVKILFDEIEKLERIAVDLKDEVVENEKMEKKIREEIASLNTRTIILERKEIPELMEKIDEKTRLFNDLKKLEKQYPDIKNAIKMRQEEIERKKKRIIQHQSRLDELKIHLRYLEKDRCPTCSSKITESIRMIVRRKKIMEIKKITNNIESLKKELRRCENELNGLENVYERIAILKNKVEDLERLKIDLNEKKDEVRKIRNNINSKVVEMEGFLRILEKKRTELKSTDLERERLLALIEDAKILDGLKRRLKTSKLRLSTLEKRKEKLENELEGVKISLLREEFRELVAKERELQTYLKNLKERVEDKRANLLEYETRWKIIKDYEKKKEIYETIVKQLKRFEHVLKITQQELREEFVKNVNYIMKEIWDDVYPYKDFEDIRLTVEDDYVLQLKRDGMWISADGIISGGERSAACLALRIAFSMAFIPNLKWLILDEPTHNLDANAIEHFSMVLLERLGRFAEQVFIITHEDISSGLETIYRFERNKEMGEPTRIKTS